MFSCLGFGFLKMTFGSNEEEMKVADSHKKNHNTGCISSCTVNIQQEAPAHIK